jgi:hypothetical protein
MKTITIIEGVTLTATQSTIDTYLAEKREAEVLAELTAWLADPANRYSEEYSDIYKDVYGVRPRW